jgi:hypothetical protein
MNQERWASLGGSSDLEAEHDGREPDVDDEDGNDDELTLGRSEALNQSRGEAAADDLEPSLGSVNAHNAAANQRRWSQGDLSGHDPEWQCEDEGAVFDDELPLGWTTQGNQGPHIGTAPNGPEREVTQSSANIGDEHL